MALFRKGNSSAEPSGPGRKPSTVLWHRGLRSLLYLLAWIFLLLVCIGNISNKPVLRETYFMKLDLTHIIPISVPNAVLINSIARTIGLHDFYQVGLWNFCEGYANEGITHCSDTQNMYWFNPLEIILNELLSGATSMYHALKRLTTVVDQTQLPSPRTSPMRFKSLVSPHTGCSASSSSPPSSPSSLSSSPRSPSPLGRRKPSPPTRLSIKFTLPTADAPLSSCAHSPSSSSPSSLLSSLLSPPSSLPSCSPSSKTCSCRRAPSLTSRLHWAPA